MLAPSVCCHLHPSQAQHGGNVLASLLLLGPCSPAALKADVQRCGGTNQRTERIRLMGNSLYFTPCLLGTEFACLSITSALWGGLGGGQLLRLASPHPVASSLALLVSYIC